MIWVLFMVIVLKNAGGVTVSDHLAFATKDDCESWESLAEIDMNQEGFAEVASHMCIPQKP